MRLAIVAAVPAVPEWPRGLYAVRQVPGAVLVRQSVRCRPPLGLRLGSDGHEVAVQISPAHVRSRKDRAENRRRQRRTEQRVVRRWKKQVI